MDVYTASTYGDRIAGVYDGFHPGLADADRTVEFLAGLAGAGPALELAIGTGRIALPLSARGVQVHGIDASEAMVSQLRAKPGGDAIPVTVGDFADVGVDGAYPLVFVVFNTLFALLSGKEQARCFRNVAGHLTPGGCFVIEAFVPDLSRFDRGQRVHATAVATDEVRLDVSLHDAENQRVDSTHVVITKAGIELYPVRIRYAWPAELDLMAQLAGLRLRERWAGWGREPFGEDSTGHVSVYETSG